MSFILNPYALASGGSAPIAMVAANRTSVTAPAIIHFGMNGATNVDQPSTDWSQEFHLDWDFDDPSAGTWISDGTSQNEAIGHTTGHVFKTPGTFIVLAHATKRSDLSVKTYYETITVADPDTTYASTTRYVKVGGDDGADGLTDGTAWATWGAAMTYVFGGNTRRVLFKKGDTFTPAAGATTTVTRTGVFIGSYGTGDRPIINVDIDSGSFLELYGTDNRIVSLNFQNAGTGATCITQGPFGLTHDCVMNGFESFHPAFADDVGLSECVGTNSQGTNPYFCYAGGGPRARLSILGCATSGLTSGAGGAVIRNYSYEGVVCGNDFGSSAGTVKAAMNLAHYACVTHNYIHTGNSEPMWIGDTDDFLVNVLVEANRFVEPAASHIIKVMDPDRVTIRNNWFHFTENAAVAVASAGSGVYVDNCSGYATGTDADLAQMVRLDIVVSSTDVRVRNCVMWKPAGGAATMLSGTGGTETTNLSVATNPLFVDPVNGDLRIAANSPCLGAGTDGITLYDHNGVSRAGGDGTDIGAFEYAVMEMTAASRTSGVAPLSVFLDAADIAAGSTSMVQPASGNFADFDYRWNYDNAAGAGTFAANGKSKNRACGQIAATVLESAGTYDFTCRLTRATDGAVLNYIQTITVTDADTVYAGQTFYYDATLGSDTTGDGSIGNPYQTWVGHANSASTKLFASNGPRRVLLKRGETFTAASTVAPTSKTGPFHIGAYGSGANPIISATSGALFTVEFASSVTDVRMVDVDLVYTSGTRQRGIRLGADCLLSRVRINGFEQNIGMPDDLTYINNVVSECTLENPTTGGGVAYNIINGQIRRFALLDCYMDAPTAMGANMRNYGDRSCFQGNEWTATALVTAIKLFGAAGVKYHQCFTDNLVLTQDAEPMRIGGEDGDIRNVLVEGNHFAITAEATRMMEVRTPMVTVRSNKFDVSGLWTHIVQANSTGGAGTVPSDLRVDNNTVFCATTPGGTWRILNGHTDMTGALVRNNIAWCAGLACSMTVGDGSATFTTNLVTNPSFVNEGTRDFHLQSGSAARGAGTDGITFYDYDEVSRVGGDGTDQGAYEYVA